MIKVMYTIETSEPISMCDVSAFETNSHYGFWNQATDEYILMDKDNDDMFANNICDADTIEQLDSYVFAETGEHITGIYKKYEYKIILTE